MASSLIYIVDDEETIRKLLEHNVTKRWGHEARTFESGEACLDALIDDPDLILLDIMLGGISGVETLKEIRKRRPDLPVIMLSAQASIEVAIESLKIGATDYFSKPIDFAKLEISVRNSLQLRQISLEMSSLKERIQNDVQFENIVSASGEMQEVFRLVSKVKNSEIPVLVMGESGTGKELISRAIHFNSHRKEAPFVVVNCASIPHELLESELFGHEKGAFTGAYQRRIGRFEQAHTGTIFLDEIGEMDLALQAKLLRVIQTKEFQRVGGNETITSDVRLVSATNRDIREEVRHKRFREDLYFRIAAFPIVIPPLRQRRSDILILAEHFLKSVGKANSKTLQFSRETLRLLYDYPWPGNVRELENVIQRAVVMTEGKEVTPGDLPASLQSFLVSPSTTDPFVETEQVILPLDKVKEAALRNALKITKGNIAEASARLKLGRATLYRLMKKYRISP